ncbi:MAG TPA: MFS transporter [Kofleriaceae bacterium]
MKYRSPLLPIFLIVLVDVLGFTIVFPVLQLYAETFGASPLVATLLTSVYAICSLVSTPTIGRLSDRHGRKPLLMISQAGTFAGFIMLGIANSLWLVFVGRILDGITAGNLSTAQAYISDHTTPENRAKAFGVIGVAFGIGFLFGPAMGGVLSDAYGQHVPFLVAAGLSACSIFATYTLLPKHEPAPRDAAPPPAEAATKAAGPAAPAGRRPDLFDLRVYAEYFRRPKLGSLYVQFFLFAFAFSCFVSGFALFAHGRYGWSRREVGWMFAYSGLLGIILQGGLIGRLVKKLGEAKLALMGFGAMMISFALLGFAYTLSILIVAGTISAFGTGVTRPVLTALISQNVGRAEQGVALGISGSLTSLAMTVAPPTGGLFLNHESYMGWAFVACVAATVGFVFSIATRAKPPRPA